LDIGPLADGAAAPAPPRELLLERTLALVSGEANRRGAAARPWRTPASPRGGVILVRLGSKG
ncbi:MAG TPA: hypothetical protein VKA84_03350, partial [Gemmatimonadaceae bacterium]|nr:hypothetical protein [Gemmatimonadaceae bacterium]